MAQQQRQDRRDSSTILRRKQVLAESGDSRSTLYNKIAQGLWPKPVKLGARSVGWPAREVAALNEARIAGQTNPEIQALVAKLEAARTIHPGSGLDP